MKQLLQTSLDNIECQNDQKELAEKNKSMLYRVKSQKLLHLHRSQVDLKETIRVSPKIATNKTLKLRDYLFLTQINSKKAQSLRNSSPQALSHRFLESAAEICLKSTASKSSLRSAKYEIDNKHIFCVVATQIKSDLANIGNLVNSITENLQKSIPADSVEPEDMVQIYNLRRTVKDKILKQLLDVEYYLVNKKATKQKELSMRNYQNKIELSMSSIYEKDESKNKQSEEWQNEGNPIIRQDQFRSLGQL